MYTIKDDRIVLSLRRDTTDANYVVLYANEEQVGYFDAGGLNLIQGCITPGLPVDESGRLAVRK